MFKFATALVPALAALSLLLTGCGSGSSSAEEAGSAADATAEIGTIKRMLDDALGQYRRGQVKAADRTVGDAYLEHFEDLEQALEERDHELMEELEHRLSTGIREQIKDRAPADEVATTVAATKRDLDRAARALKE